MYICINGAEPWWRRGSRAAPRMSRSRESGIIIIIVSIIIIIIIIVSITTITTVTTITIITSYCCYYYYYCYYWKAGRFVFGGSGDSRG